MFKDRKEAGEKLAVKLKKLRGSEVVVYALPRGGVTVAVEIAKVLQCPLDILVSRKIGHPFSPEFAIGAIAPDGHRIFNEAKKSELAPVEIKRVTAQAATEAKRREAVYLGKQGHWGAQNKTAIIVDDGIATGLTMRLAIKEIRHQHPKKIIIVVPVLPREVALLFGKKVDEIVALLTEENYLGAVGAYYKNFPQVTDAEVINIISKYNTAR